MIAETASQQLLLECTQWRNTLRQYRDQINDLSSSLYQSAAGKTNQDVLKQVDHFHNQFHIQLINIHDVKHLIKEHAHQIEHHPNFGHKIPHHQLQLQYEQLVATINTLQQEFAEFKAT